MKCPKKDLVRGRIKAAGERIGVHVYPHRLRHTCATQLLNAGCRVTSLQRFLGHTTLKATMIYARVHDRTVAEDYFTAMEEVEKRLDLTLGEEEKPAEALAEAERAQLLVIAEQLSEPELSQEIRRVLVARLLLVLAKPRSRSIITFDAPP